AVALSAGFLLEGAQSALPAAVHKENVAEIRKHADLLLDLPHHVGRGDDDLGLRVGHDMGDLGLAEKEDHRYDHRAHAQDAPVALHHLWTVGEHDYHTIAGLHLQAHQGTGDAGSR